MSLGVVLCLAGATAPLISGCRAAAEKDAPAPKPQVRAVTLALEKIEPRIPIAGVLAPLPGRDVKVGALVPGRIDRVLVAEGDPVRPGQALATVEARSLQDRLAETEAQAELANAALDAAEKRLARTEHLLKDGIASKQEVDDARAAAATAASALKQARAGGSTAQLQLERATLRAPIAGVVAAILVPAGQPVDGNGTPVIEIADTRTLDLRAPVPVARAGEIALGQKAELTVAGFGGGSETGTVAAIAPLVDPATNTIMVRIRVPNRGALRGGMYARGALLGEAREAIAVPKSALLPNEGAANKVAVIDSGGELHLVEVELGVEVTDRVEVKTGLTAGVRVAVAGAYSIPEGAKVEILP
jgi:RND family efflux transporter MFP subunit